MALTTTGQAQSLEGRHVVSRVATTRPAQRTVVARSTSRNVVARQHFSRGRYYYGGGPYYYSGYSPYYYGGPSVSVGIGGVYGYPGYYGYPYDYTYGYPSAYYDQYPNGYTTTTTTYRTSRYGDLAYDDNLVIAVQERLQQAGYYHGAIDAVAGPGTRSAIARWEADHGMTADGLIDQETLQALGISYS